MSVFGGDSWAREAQYRKRRVNDLLVEALDGSSYKKLSSGKYACLVCPNDPILDSPLMLSMHNKGSRHLAAELRLKEKELMKQNEMNKRIALSGPSTVALKFGGNNQNLRLAAMPPSEQTQKTAETATGIVFGKSQEQFENRNSKMETITNHTANRTYSSAEKDLSSANVETDKVVSLQHLNFRELREKELKFTAAGWKRDCHGKWYRDENVEFDSDEEDPNICLGWKFCQ